MTMRPPSEPEVPRHEASWETIDRLTRMSDIEAALIEQAILHAEYLRLLRLLIAAILMPRQKP
jgi:hypothetical protein